MVGGINAVEEEASLEYSEEIEELSAGIFVDSLAFSEALDWSKEDDLEVEGDDAGPLEE